tara:strand:+ start:496 stop:1584 length:1089 start_codon:yes stop_codon:yes gene_type:complete
MQISSLKIGMVFKRVGRWDDDSRSTSESPFHEVVDILNDDIEGGYRREVVTLGNVSDKSTITVTIRNLNNLRLWEEVKGAAVVEDIEVITTTRKVRKIVFLHGTEEVISDYEVIDDSPVVVEVKKPSKPVPPKKKQEKEAPKKVVIVKPEVISGEEIKRAAQHKEARDGRSNAITSAFANIKAKAKGVVCADPEEEVSEENRKPAKANPDSDVVMYDNEFYWRLMRYTYQDLDVLGAALIKCVPIFEDIHVVPKYGSKAVHQQELDKFRDGNVQLREIRAMGNRIRSNTPDQIGTPVSPQQIVKRMMRAFYHWGSHDEKESLGLNKRVSELPYGKQNQKRIQAKIDSANRKSRKFKTDLKNT